MLVGVVTDPNQIEEALKWADLVEFRLDHFEVEKRPPFPVIFTLRKKEQEGVREMEEGKRLEKIEQLLTLSPDYVDIEADTDPAFIDRMAKKFPHVQWIGSHHNFEGIPDDLSALLKQMQNPHFAMYKIAVTPPSTPDLLRFLLFASQANVPLSAIAMGPYGRASRVLGPVIGSALDYAGIEDDPVLHRYSLQTLSELFHYRKLNQKTRVYALIGDPVEQSPGERFHNPRFRHNGVYVKLAVKKEELAESLRLIRQLPFAGLSVTMPLKEAILPLLDKVSEEALSIGAVNTVTFAQNKATGTNTDAPGALNALEKKGSVRGKRLAILGAGGTARAIAFEAKKRGAIVSVYNRSKERVARLAADLECAGARLDELQEYDILVNTIPHLDEVPWLVPHAVVMDVVHTPKETPLLRAAQEKWCRCVYGEEMFIEQALLQQEAWEPVN